MWISGDTPGLKRRLRYPVVIVIVAFLALLARLWQLQVLDAELYQRQTEVNFLQVTPLPTMRGSVYDCCGHLLATNRASYDVYVIPQFIRRESFSLLTRYLSIDPSLAAQLWRRIEQTKGKQRQMQRLVRRDITRDQLAQLEAERLALAGVQWRVRPVRSYPYGQLAAHVVGYLGEVSADELNGDHGAHYRSGDQLGRFGVERLYEAHLRGVSGEETTVVDARGHRMTGQLSAEMRQKERRVDPVAGHNMVLTINVELQRVLEQALKAIRSGAAVVLQANTGRILASASWPGFDPNLLSQGLTTQQAQKMTTDDRRPLLDKVYRENYYPASTFKVVTALAALQRGVVDWDDKVNCTGAYALGGHTFRCAHRHKQVTLHDALVQSCNVFFYDLVQRIGIDGLAETAYRFGLGATTGVGINGEVEGFIPTKSWYAQTKRPFRLGYTLNAAIGQGNTKATVIQIAMLYAAIANGGKLLTPQIVERIESDDGTVLESFAPRIRRDLALSPDVVNRLHRALWDVVHDRDGTAYEARIPGLSIAGKTGTAQLIGGRRRQQQVTADDDHAWFAGFAPIKNPQIVVVVLVEHGGAAGKVAAPLAMSIAKRALHDR